MHGRELPEVLSIIRTGKNNVVSLLTLRMRFNVLRQRRQVWQFVVRKVPNASLKKTENTNVSRSNR